MSNNTLKKELPRILTNMAFWQSPAWCERTDSIYEMMNRSEDPQFMSSGYEAWVLFRRKDNYDVVVTMGARTSLLYGLLCAIFHRTSRQIMTEVFIDEPRPRQLVWRLKIALFRLVARRCIGILTNSSTEVRSITQRFRLRDECVCYVPMHSTIWPPSPSHQENRFILSAGRSGRDYDVLFDAAAAIDFPIIIISGKESPPNPVVPPNVTVIEDIDRKEYLDYLKRCTLVALPLQATERSTGQVVLLEAMSIGKPVVATRVPGTIDHIRPDITGLLVSPGDAAELASQITRLLNSEEQRCNIAQHALEYVQLECSFDLHAERKLRRIYALWNNRTLH